MNEMKEINYARQCVSPEIDGSSLKIDCQSSKPTVPNQATISFHDLTPAKTMQAQLLAWLNHFFFNVPSARFSPDTPSGVRNQTQQVFHGTQPGPSTKVAKPSPIDQESESDSCPAEEEPGINNQSSSSGLKGSTPMHSLNHRCLQTTICASTNKLLRCYRNRSLYLNRCPA